MIMNYLTTNKVAITNTGATAVIMTLTRPTKISIVSDIDFHFRVSKTNLNATTSSPYVPAGVEKVLSLAPDDTLKLIGNSTAGNVWVSQVTFSS